MLGQTVERQKLWWVRMQAAFCNGEATGKKPDDDFTGRKSPGNEAESATPRGKDPPALHLPRQGDPGAACHSYSNVAGGDTTH
ncbi:hypothetical protein CVIRNUC_008147 [Coccomyxa viridis]|uniref:Uncharacterized protein n=1 Tax=Coccomyxa viridis TaxID=1274662 RepID=A0AAV1IE11_9CHLO|nr:hypothetical protein CVIRNUC_008147 [Coccomyxa viridis]